jgi:hypothetical protein
MQQNMGKTPKLHKLKILQIIQVLEIKHRVVWELAGVPRASWGRRRGAGKASRRN